MPGKDVVRSLTVSDVLLFVRGHISTRRGSAIAGIACGLPVIAFEGPETAAPITEAGLALQNLRTKGNQRGHAGLTLAAHLAEFHLAWKGDRGPVRNRELPHDGKNDRGAGSH